MADPVVCGFLTKVLCSRGGCVEAREILQHVALSEQQLRQILEDAGQERFVLHREGGSTWVLAVSSVRVCIRKTCGGGCDRLHLCKSNLMGRCRFGFITKILCSNGGCLDYTTIPQYLDLSDHQLQQILQDSGKERFLVDRQGTSCQVLAVSPVRLCLRNECEGCERLHVCKNYMKSKCYRPIRGKWACKYNHDIFSEENRKVLKNHELSGLNEDELRVLLLQNDPFLLPDVCRVYNRGEGNCPQQDDCPRLHVCHFFLRGECRFPRCKRSHSLVHPTAQQLLRAEGVDDQVASNIQRICEHKTAALCKEIRLQRASRPAERANPNAGHQRELRREQTPDKSTLLDLGTKPFPLGGGSDKPGAGDQHESKPENTGGTRIQQTPVKPLLDLGLSPGYISFPTPATSDRSDKPGAGVQQESKPETARATITEASAKLPLYLGTTKLNPQGSVSTENLGSGPSARAAKEADLYKPHRSAEKKKSDEICLFYVWQFCKHKNECSMIHYHLPYRWQIHSGIEWKDCANMEEVEKAYCDPNVTSFPTLNINFKTMFSYVSPVRRLSTPSSITKPAKFVMTTKWLWYWKNDQGQWIEYGKPDGQRPGSNLNSDDLENVFLADPKGSIQFQAGSQNYEINFKDMTQTNMHFLTQRELRRRPKFVSTEDVKNKKGHTDHTSAAAPELNYPKEWDKSALPEIGYKAIEISKTSPEYAKIEKLFQKTMSTYVIQRLRRIQNPSLWQVFQWQKDQMKKKNGGRDVDERLLFHGTSSSVLVAICNDNFDWRICGTNGTVFGKGSYFARDAQYSHSYCQGNAKTKTMFVAQVLVGDFVTGHASYARPPRKSPWLDQRLLRQLCGQTFRPIYFCHL
ncbi:hypothetical protein lerEdw1_011971 [Lerista edwardsae]|nr:hypothetical protein lerEdw1_011971 [Lerista edwardsae]